MKCGRFGLASVAVVLLLASFAFSQEAMMLLEHRELGVHERPPVPFSHEKHADILDCLRCHHDFDQYGNNRGGEDKAQSCAACHGQASSLEKKLVPLEKAFHGQCKGCHESMWTAGKKSGPVTCGECHVKKK